MASEFETNSNKMMKRKWNKYEIRKLISIYRDKEILWNIKSDLYKKNELKSREWRAIAQKFHVSEEEVKKKVRALRTTYVNEKNKVEEAKKAHNIYVPNLFYFDEMGFLSEAIVHKKPTTHVKIQQDDSTMDSSEDPMFEQVNVDDTSYEIEEHSQDVWYPRRKPTKQRKVERANASYEESMRKQQPTMSQYQPDDQNKYMVFCKSIALQLQDLPPLSATKAMQEIQTIISKYTEYILNQEANIEGISRIENMPSRQAEASPMMLLDVSRLNPDAMTASRQRYHYHNHKSDL